MKSVVFLTLLFPLISLAGGGGSGTSQRYRLAKCFNDSKDVQFVMFMDYREDGADEWNSNGMDLLINGQKYSLYIWDSNAFKKSEAKYSSKSISSDWELTDLTSNKKVQVDIIIDVDYNFGGSISIIDKSGHQIIPATKVDCNPL